MAEVCIREVDTGFVALGYAEVAVLGVVKATPSCCRFLPPHICAWCPLRSARRAPVRRFSADAVCGLGSRREYFWSDGRGLAARSLRAIARGQWRDRHLRFSLWIVLATIPIGIAGLSLASTLNACHSPLRTVSVIGWACVAMALLLGVAEVRARHRRVIEEASLFDAMLVGIAQVGALIPGVSRSGSTLTAALALGFKRDEAARLSFLLGLPAIALAGAKEIWELHKIHLDGHGWSILAFGLIVASISAFFAIWG